MDAALAKLAGDSTVAQQTADLAPIQSFVASNLPVIPVTTGSDWFEYNSQHFVGLPTQLRRGVRSKRARPWETRDGLPHQHRIGPVWGRDPRLPVS